MSQLWCMFVIVVSFGTAWLSYIVHKTETNQTNLFVLNHLNGSNKTNTVKSSTKTRIFITGIGHSATSYVQQFIGDVLYNKQDVFYLFEATHSHTIDYQLPFYNITTEPRGKLISYYFECNFPNMNYLRAFHHFKFIKKFNVWNRNQSVSGSTLTQKCLSSKYLIYKEIIGQYSKHLLQLWQQFPSLKIIAMVRNPISHIPSWRRMVRHPPDLNHSINKFCDRQLHEIQYGLDHGYDSYGIQRFFVFKLEDFFHNITHELNNTVKYYYQNVLDIQWNTSEETEVLQQLNVAYDKMMGDLWSFNHKHALKKTQTLNSNEKQEIVEGCYQFNMLFDYVEYAVISNESKVFEIGLPKTGTTSLKGALEDLGYVAAGWNANLYNEYKSTNNVSRVLSASKQYEAFVDGPWHTIDFRIWDKVYPNAKFILLDRNESAWLRSLESHFSPAYNVNNIAARYLDDDWINNRDEIKNRMLQKKDDKYNRIRKVFENRPSKLLIIDTSELEWKQICEFLNKSIPSKPFPVANKSNRKKEQS